MNEPNTLPIKTTAPTMPELAETARRSSHCGCSDLLGGTVKYSIIYADPPWNGLGWNNGSGKKCPARHYAVQDIEWIKSLPVQSIAAENCALFLWVTFPNLPEGIDTIKAWGFRYATIGFNWVKRNKKSPSWFWGCGNYTRANSEICLLGMKGSLAVQ